MTGVVYDFYIAHAAWSAEIACVSCTVCENLTFLIGPEVEIKLGYRYLASISDTWGNGVLSVSFPVLCRIQGNVRF